MDFTQNDLLARLERIDEMAALLLTASQKRFIYIAGGSALILQQYLPRATHDIDALESSRELETLLADFDINTNVNAYRSYFPFDYESRVQLLKEGQAVDFYTVSLEDIVIAKLYSSREKDAADIRHEAVIASLNWALLERLAKGEDQRAVSIVSDREYKAFLHEYELYVEECKP